MYTMQYTHTEMDIAIFLKMLMTQIRNF